jgi:threonylcarbamoyladenosine tRNA methylthiotransferase MtaB
MALKSASKVPSQTRKERTKKMLTLSEVKKKIFYDAHIGKQARVFFESERKNGYLYGFTENYIRARIPWSAEAINSILPVLLIQPNNEDSFDAELSKL